MKNKKLILTIFLFCTVILSTSCNSDKNSSSKTSVVTDASSSASENSDVSDGSTVSDNKKTSVSETSVSGDSNIIIDSEGKVAIIKVTDSKGAQVTDSQGKQVTEIAAIDSSNKPVTDTMGNFVPPNASGGNANYKYGSLLWMADDHLDSATNKHVFDVIKEDGQIFAVQFKVKANAASGDYEISFQRKTTSGSGAFSTSEGMGIDTTYSSGTISVGSDTAAAEKEFSGFTCYFTNAAAKPGDTVTVYGSVKNNPGFSAFNAYLRYDSDVFELQGIKAAGLLEKTGEFITG